MAGPRDDAVGGIALNLSILDAEYSDATSSRRISHGTTTVQPLVTQCLSLLLLLRNYEEHTATAAAARAATRGRKKAKGASASEQEKERDKRDKEGQLRQLELWEASFTAVLEEMRPLEGANALVRYVCGSVCRSVACVVAEVS